jgi:hypothetical protein
VVSNGDMGRACRVIEDLLAQAGDIWRSQEVMT